MRKFFACLICLTLFWSVFAIDSNLIFKETYNQNTFNNLDVDLTFEDITINEIYGNDIIIEIFCNNSTRMPKVETQADTIKIQTVTKFTSIGNICRILVYIPQEKNLNNVKISSTSGDVKLRKLSAANLSVSTASADIDAERVVVSKNVLLKAASGDIDIDNLFADKTVIKTASGDIETEDLTSPDLTIQSASGEIDCKRSKVEYLLTESRSGRIRIYSLHADYFDVSSTSGEVYCHTLFAPKAKSSLKTISGHITFKINDNEAYNLVVSGRKEISKQFNGGGAEVSISTRSGGIDLE